MQEITVNDAVARYLIEVRDHYRSYRSLSSILLRFSLPFSGRRLDSLVGPDIYDYVYRRRREGRKANTINQELKLIRTAINHARYRWGVVMDNPVVNQQRLKAGLLRLRYLTYVEAARLLSCAPTEHLRLFMQLALHTGCRKNELLTLAWTDIDDARALLKLRAENTKGAKPRSIPLNRRAMEAVEALKRLRVAGVSWVFSKPNGSRIKTIYWHFKKALQAAGIEDFRVHDLRHTFASWLVSEGVELIKVRDLLGHSSIKMTERYAHLMPDRLLEAVQVLENVG